MAITEFISAIMAWRAKLHWCHVRGRTYWAAETPQEYILVDTELYQRILREELKKQGIEMKTWSEYMRPGEEAWKRQCAVEDALKSNLDFWKQVKGVHIWTHN